MLKFDVKIPEVSMAAIKKAVERKAAEVVAKVANDIYEDIVANKRPYWSGEYLASWNITFGHPSTLRLVSAGFDKERGQGKGADFHYFRPRDLTILPNYSNPYESIFVSNAALHSYKVEFEGTPTHPQGGWMIATGAVNDVVGKYRFF
jgi:hypothetical protein